MKTSVALALHPIRLHNEGNWFVVSIEYRGRWVDVLRTPYCKGGVLSHIVEPCGIRKCIDEAGL